MAHALVVWPTKPGHVVWVTNIDYETLTLTLIDMNGGINGYSGFNKFDAKTCNIGNLDCTKSARGWGSALDFLKGAQFIPANAWAGEWAWGSGAYPTVPETCDANK